jgi:fructose-bisphosphate aldolase class I
MDYSEELKNTVQALLALGKGILAADESLKSIGKKLTEAGVADTPDNHRAYRELFFTTPGVSQYISGVILFDETIRQLSSTGVPLIKILLDQGIVPGIKVDTGIEPMPDSVEEKITQGIDTLPSRLPEYYKMGARFAKWRAVFTIGKGIPTQMCVDANAELLAEYALLCQQNGLVPIVEPEVLMDGDHGIDQCEEVTLNVLKTVFAKLRDKGVMLEGILLKPNMVCPGTLAPVQSTPEQVAAATAEVLLKVVPPQVPGIVFLSGGQSEERATLELNLIAKLHENYPWQITFSYGRALENSALKVWQGGLANVPAAQKVFLHRAKMNSLARDGKYELKLEKGI